MRAGAWALTLAAGLAGLAGGWWYQHAGQAEPVVVGASAAVEPADLVGQRRPDFTLGATTGAKVSAADFDGKVLLVNFWATWCEPCREEMPMLSALHEALAPRGFRVLGIALDEVSSAREFAEGLGISYPVLVGMGDVIAVGRRYGNSAGLLPYSVLVDRAGIVRWADFGALSREELAERVAAHL